MVMTSASHAEGREFESRLEYFFCQFMKLHAQGTLLPYREVRRARVYSRYENSPRPASSSTGARRRRVAGEEALCGRTAWSAARSSSARPRPGPRCGKCTEPCPWGLEASHCPLQKPLVHDASSGLQDTRQADKESSHCYTPKSKQTDASHSHSCQNPGATGSTKKASWRPPTSSKMQCSPS